MSGIYILKMKLPRNCGECPFFVDDGEYPFDEDGTWCGRANYLICDGKVGRGSKPEWCDLIPVPDHGRLIDASTLPAGR